MAARGTIAKQNVIQKMAEAFGKEFIGEYDKKIYVWAQDGGERVQIALSLTCPKTMINAMDAEMPEAPAGDFDWSMDAPAPTPAPKAPVEISQEEKDTVAELMAKLGL